MSSFSSLPFDLILLALVAGFLTLRLRSILGRRVGLEIQARRPAPARAVPAPQTVDVRPKAEPEKARLEVPAPATRVGGVLTEIAAADRVFQPQSFLRGCELTFSRVVEAFAAGNRDVLRQALSADAYDAFEQAIASREAAGETQVSEIRAVSSLGIEDARCSETEASVEVRIVSQQISYLKGRDGDPVSGTESVTEFSDLWTFARNFGGEMPRGGASWRLISAQPA